MVRVQPATIQYWNRTFAEFVGNTINVNEVATYDDEQVALFRRIRDDILEQGYSVPHVRQCLAMKEDDHAPHTHLAQQVNKLQAEIAFLAEESKEHQRLLGNLVKTLLEQRNHAGLTQALADAAQALHDSTSAPEALNLDEHITVHENYKAPLPSWEARNLPRER